MCWSQHFSEILLLLAHRKSLQAAYSYWVADCFSHPRQPSLCWWTNSNNASDTRWARLTIFEFWRQFDVIWYQWCQFDVKPEQVLRHLLFHLDTPPNVESCRVLWISNSLINDSDECLQNTQIRIVNLYMVNIADLGEPDSIVHFYPEIAT